MGISYFLAIIPILIYLGIFGFAIYVVLTILNLMKQRNEYLKNKDNILQKRQCPKNC